MDFAALSIQHIVNGFVRAGRRAPNRDAVAAAARVAAVVNRDAHAAIITAAGIGSRRATAASIAFHHRIGADLVI